MTDRTLRLPLVLAVPAIVLLAGGAAPAAAQDSPLDRLSIHGFLTQAYAMSDGHQYLGIPDHGTNHYRVAALQFRYDASDRDAFVLQLSHERLGNSPLDEFEPAVDLDWVFYEHRFGTNTTARVGKIRSPVGIYNEIRDVGTLLPLYRPPLALYGEQFYASETVDGVMVGHRVPLGDWTLQLEGFFGDWEYVQFDLETVAHVNGAVGTQAWLQTPLPGVRLGGAAVRYPVRDVLGAPDEFEDAEILWLGSLDATFRRTFVRGEGYHTGFGDEAIGYVGDAQGYYGQAGFNVTEQVSLVAQAELTDVAFDVLGPQPFTFDDTLDRDLALGLRYQPSPFLALKLELHRYRGYSVEDEALTLGVDDPVNVTYGLLSVSTSF